MAVKGFRDASAAEAMIARLGDPQDGLVEQIASVAGPDVALQSLAEIADAMGADRLLALLEERELR